MLNKEVDLFILRRFDGRGHLYQEKRIFQKQTIDEHQKSKNKINQ